METVVATIFVSPIVKLLITKMSNYCSGEIALVRGFKDKLEKLSETLELIEAVLGDAEKRQIENDRLVRLWLKKLKDVAHDADDILDELQCEDLGLKLENERNILRLFPPKQFGFGYKNKMAHKIKDVNRKLDEITQVMEKFKFLNQLGTTSGRHITVMNEKRSETSSDVNDSSAIVGRIDDISKILDLLKQDSDSVVRISGMGGIGKTTLAQLVLKELAVSNEDYFKLKIWVSVSQKSDAKEIFCDLLESNKETTSSLETIKNRLKEKLKGKCLIVLDDVWIKNDNRGIDVEQLLKDILSMSGNGSKILMTMRSAEPIHPMKDCRYMVYQLQGLPENDCWSIFENMAFAHGGENWECKDPDLISIGKQIARKCGGIPLVAKTLGGLLYSKKDKSEWLSILNSQIWNLPAGENKIMSILKLSYDHLSPYVKRCFSYCSIFPKGHYFMKKELIRMWMAEGFLISPWEANSSNASPVTVGNDYFKNLLLNSFFQDEHRNKWGDIKSCRMHDLVHDLAILIAGSESQTVMVSSKEYDQEVNMQCDKFRHLGLQVLDKDVSAIPSEIYEASNVRTFVSFCPLDYEIQGNGAWAKKIFSLSLLRVLNLSHTGVEELPQSISKLKHLRYLDISHTRIHTFPASFRQLYNLQTLILTGCKLKELPKDMRKQIGLEYLVFSDRPDVYNQTPREVSRFSKLKKLSVFVVGIGKGYGIEELERLNLLGGKLIITNLERVTDARKANLKGKKDIIHLHLRWDSAICNTSDKCNKDNVVLKGLQPHPNLKELTILYFGGSEFPAWMMSTSLHLPNLVNITLYDCVNCEHLPALGRLQSLRSLYMERMGAIKQIGGEFYQSNGAASFPSLVKLYLRSFYNLEEWLGDQQASTSSFPCLESLKILDCNQLLTTPTSFRSLKKLDFEIKLISSSHLTSLPLKLIRGGNNVLQTLVVRDCKEFAGFLPDDEEQQHRHPDDTSNNFLSKIEILRCPSLTFFPADLRGFISLTYLAIEGCESLKSLPDGIQYLPALQTLIIGGFSEDLISFPFPAATGSDGEQYFISLRELKICGWPTLLDDVLPDQLQLLTSLELLSIKDFPCLLGLPEWFGELSSLQTLGIECCSRLKYLPSEEQMLRLTSLEVLSIRDCPLLLKRCCRCCGKEEWHKVARLKQVGRSSPLVDDEITRDAAMNEELLERRRSGIFANQFKEKCWIDISGRYCFMLFPRSLYIEWGQDTRYWRWLSKIEPSASGDGEIEVPSLIQVSWLHVEGKIDMSKLNPGVNYEVVFVVMMFEEWSCGWGTPVNLWLVLPNGQKLVQKVSLETMPKSKWIEIHVGDFETPQQPGDEERIVHFMMFEHVDQLWKRGFVIEGAIVRPKK